MPDVTSFENISGSSGTQDKYLWIVPDAQTRWLWKLFAEAVGQRLGLRPLMIVATEADRRFYESQFGRPFKGEIVVLPSIYEVIHDELLCADPQDFDEVVDHAHRYEKRHGITLMRQFILPDRIIGRAYMRGGLGHPVSSLFKRLHRQTALRACVYSFERIEDLARQYPPRLVTKYGAFGGQEYKPIALYCREREIPIRCLTGSRFGGYYYWADDEYENSADFLAFWQSLPDVDEAAITRVQSELEPNSMATSEYFLASNRRSANLSNAICRIFYLLLQRAYWKLRGYRKGIFTYTVRSTASQLLRAVRHWSFLDKFAVRNVEELEGRKVIYFPLQTEPEASISDLSPYHTFQLTTLSELSLGAPSNAIILVKEHRWQVGRRPAQFYDLAMQMPNVVLGHPEMDSLALIRRSDLIVTITSSAGHEASALGKPVLYCCRNGFVHELDHVFDGENFNNFNLIPQLLEMVDDETSAKRRHDGAKYYQAIEQFCMNLDDMEIHGREAAPTNDEVEILISHLFATLFPSMVPTGSSIKNLRSG